jgi:hypothetical protein
MPVTQDVIAINVGFSERRRTTGSGTKSRYTFEIDAEPILHNLSQEKLGDGPAHAIARAITAQIKNITEVASLPTRQKRERAKRALAAGADWAVKRYSGGRTGTKPPSGSVRFGNDSGRLAEGIFVRQNPEEKNWTVNVPANRLDPSTFGSYPAFLAWVARLRAHVPVLANPLGVAEVKEAIRDSVDVLIQVEKDRTGALRTQRNQALAQVFSSLGGLGG